MVRLSINMKLMVHSFLPFIAMILYNSNKKAADLNIIPMAYSTRSRQNNDLSETWIKQANATSFNPYHKHFMDVSKGIAVGILGSILKTSKGGHTWTTQASDTPKDYYAFQYSEATSPCTIGTGTILFLSNPKVNEKIKALV